MFSCFCRVLDTLTGELEKAVKTLSCRPASFVVHVYGAIDSAIGLVHTLT